MLCRDNRKGTLLASVRAVLNALGVVLEPAVRALMEARFGRDFSSVRLHVDGRAAAATRAISAQACTIGSHVVFGEGCYAPETPAGLWLLAHELAHVIQQSGEICLALSCTGDIDTLERAADRAADLVAAGRHLPPGFVFGVAPSGAIQYHKGPGCPGVPSPGGASNKAVSLGASLAIRAAYLAAFPGSRDSVLFGEDFEGLGRLEIQLPRSSPHRKWGNYLLQRLRGKVKQRRPDIIDFEQRTIYEIKTVNYVTDGIVQVESYNKLAEEIRVPSEFSHVVPSWNPKTRPFWYPPHVLPLFGSPMGALIVCTQATDYTRPNQEGLILYEIRMVNKKQRTRDIRVEDFDRAAIDLQPTVRAQLPKTVPFFDPMSPDYIIIAPQEFYSLDFVKRKYQEQLQRKWDLLGAPTPPFLNTRLPVGQFTRIGTYLVAFFVVAELATAAAAIILVAAAGAVAGAEVVATTAATTEVVATTTVTSTAPTVVDLTANVVAANAAVDPALAATIQAALASEAARRAITIAAGAAVLIIGKVKLAQAAPSRATLDDIIMVQALPLDRFQLVGGVLRGSSNDKLTSPACVDASKVSVGTKVMYDGKPHFVLGRFSVK
jgi:hypothetical protein